MLADRAGLEAAPAGPTRPLGTPRAARAAPSLGPRPKIRYAENLGLRFVA